MKTIVSLFLALVYTAVAVPLSQELPGLHQYSRYIQFLDGQGVSRTIDLEEEPDTQVLSDVTRNPANNLYLLYTRKNPTSSQILVVNDPESIWKSNFNAEVPTVVIAHGWLGNQNTGINPLIRDAYLAKSDVNVIVLDWRRLALSSYPTTARGVPAVGRGLGQFLAFLSQLTGAPLSKLHLVGFSMGAHLVGNAGRELGGQVARITALDPAGPLWYANSERVNPNDAIYVEAIHTNGGLSGIGIGNRVADVDFFPNGGNAQPLCLTPVCHHNRAWEFFAATVSYNHMVGRECSNSLQLTLNTCRGQVLHMGNDDLNKTGSGMYRLDTEGRYPY